ncbi:MAG: HNH endonuclease signature motif containing protein, partial [Ilumatobacteraceae bacterium]
TRTVTRAQRRKLRAMHATCVGHGCHVSFEQCHIHHIIFWRYNGRTDITNLVPVCSKHHHLAHEGGWTLSMTPDRTVTWTRPDGTTHSTHNAIDRAPQRRTSRTGRAGGRPRNSEAAR